MNNISGSKKHKIRQKILNFRNNLSSLEINKESQIISQKVLALDEIKKCQNVLIYLQINNEVDTKSIINYLKRHKKRVCLPKFLKGKWIIVQFKNWGQLQPGPFRILQPNDNQVINVEKIDVAIIPGVAFDKNGARLGFGKGVYDKLLKDFSKPKIGLGYDFQIIDPIPMKKHDLVMDIIVTNKSILDFRTI